MKNTQSIRSFKRTLSFFLTLCMLWALCIPTSLADASIPSDAAPLAPSGEHAASDDAAPLLQTADEFVLEDLVHASSTWTQEDWAAYWASFSEEELSLYMQLYTDYMTQHAPGVDIGNANMDMPHSDSIPNVAPAYTYEDFIPEVSTIDTPANTEIRDGNHTPELDLPDFSATDASPSDLFGDDFIAAPVAPPHIDTTIDPTMPSLDFDMPDSADTTDASTLHVEPDDPTIPATAPDELVDESDETDSLLEEDIEQTDSEQTIDEIEPDDDSSIDDGTDGDDSDNIPDEKNDSPLDKATNDESTPELPEDLLEHSDEKVNADADEEDLLDEATMPEETLFDEIPRDDIFLPDEGDDALSSDVDILLPVTLEAFAPYALLPYERDDFDSISFSLSWSSREYNGQSQQPSATVTLDGSALADGYCDIIYPAASTNAGSYNISIQGREGTVFEGCSMQQSYSITPISINACTISVTSVVYTGTEQLPQISVTYNSVAIDEYITPGLVPKTAVGSYSFSIDGIGNFTDSAPQIFSIASLNLAECTATAPPLTYNGHPQTPTFTLCTPDTDTPISQALYNTNVSPQTDADTYSATFSSSDSNVSGTLTAFYTIQPFDLSNAIVRAPSLVYNGLTQTPETSTIEVYFDDNTTQIPASEYTISFPDGEERTDAGAWNFSIAATGSANYIGTTTRNFTITALDISSLLYTPTNAELVYRGKMQAPDITVNFPDGTRPLTPGDDYTYDYTNAGTEEGTYTITLNGNEANTTGSIAVDYKIIDYILDADIAVSAPSTSSRDGMYHLIGNAAAITVPDGHILIDIAELGDAVYDNGIVALDDDGIHDGVVDAPHPFGAGTIEISYRLQCISGTLEGAITRTRKVIIHQDTRYDGLTLSSITSRDSGIAYANSTGEKAYFTAFIGTDAEVDSAFHAFGDTTELEKDTYAIANGSSAQFDLSNHANTITYDSASNVDTTITNYLPAGQQVVFISQDYAGNLMKQAVTVLPYPIMGLEISGPNELPIEGGAFVITGEPNEVVKITHTRSEDYDCHVRLDASGLATVVIDPLVGIYITDGSGNILHAMPEDHFIHDSDTEHLPQSLTVTYADAQDHIEVKDGGVATVVQEFIYHSKAFPIAIDPLFNNRDLVVKIALPEEGTVLRILSDGVELYQGDGTIAERNEVVEYALQWQNAPPSLIASGRGKLEIEYQDMGHCTWSGTFDINRSTVPVPIMMQIEPEMNANGYFGQKDRNIVIFGTGTEYEPLVINVGSTMSIDVKASGEGNYLESENGTWSIPLSLSKLPRNEEIEIRVSYKDVNGPSASMLVIYDDECMPIIVTTTAYEGVRYIAGITEPGALIRIECVGQTIKATVDNEGFFHAELPMLFENENLSITAYDLAGNTQTCSLPITKEPTPFKAHLGGKLFPHYDSDVPDWAQANYITKAELEEGVTLPLLAGNMFNIGKMTLSLQDGQLHREQEIIDGVKVLDEYFYAHSTRVNAAQLLNHADTSFVTNEVSPLEDSDGYWIYSSMTVLLQHEHMETMIHEI